MASCALHPCARAAFLLLILSIPQPVASLKVPSIAKAMRGKKLTVAVELSHADLPPESDRGLGVSVHHENLYDASEEELRAMPMRALSQVLREAGVSCIAVRGRGSLIEHICNEQAEARGMFPGPVPVMYIPAPGETVQEGIADLAKAGVSGVMISQTIGAEGVPLDQAVAALAAEAAAVHSADLQAIVEIIVDAAAGEDDSLVPKVLGDIQSKVRADGVVVSASAGPLMPPPTSMEVEMVVGGVRAPWNTIRSACDEMHAMGYSGALLRSECMPLAARRIEDWGDFWKNIVMNVRSAKSKTLTIMVGQQQEKDAMQAYVEKVKSSGQFDNLGKGESLGGDFDSSRGDFVGFG